VRVLVASNHTLIGTSLMASIRSLSLDEPVEAQLCHTARVQDVARAWNPHVILLEATVDFAGAISTLCALTKELRDGHIVLLGREADQTAIYEAILEGADGYLTGDASLETLASTLKGVAQGELGLSRRAARQVVHQLRQSARARPSPPPLNLEGKLTPREQEVFDLVRRGLRSREIAQQLTIAEATANKHIQNILDKLQVHSRTQAILMSGPAEDVAELDGGLTPPAPPAR
jgi:DNA-binding NarL/FixJ family response regulator